MSAADFEDFRQPRPQMPPEMEPELDEVVRILATNRWPWRLHATYDETISRALDVAKSSASDITIYRTLVDGDRVLLHSRYEGLKNAPGPLIAFDLSVSRIAGSSSIGAGNNRRRRLAAFPATRKSTAPRKSMIAKRPKSAERWYRPTEPSLRCNNITIELANS
jgi:hypothetical protein